MAENPGESVEIAYANYWRRKQLLAGEVPAFALCRWWSTPTELCDIERVYFDAIRGASAVLDVGAGDLRIMKKFQAAGYRGEYHTQDVGGEYPHTYRSLDEISRAYAAIICLDVIEHLPLAAGLGLILRMIDLLAPGGVLILQTPNGRCIRSAFGTDMTHLHLYNVPDLWAYLTAAGLSVKGYRIPFVRGPRDGAWSRVQGLISKFAITRILGCDYAENIAVVAVKAAGGP